MPSPPPPARFQVWLVMGRKFPSLINNTPHIDADKHSVEKIPGPLSTEKYNLKNLQSDYPEKTRFMQSGVI